jgi:1-carboxybiuret hydrolase
MAAALCGAGSTGISPVKTALGIAHDIRTGAVSAAALLAQTEARILSLNPALNCFTATTFERARREAAAVDALRARGAALPPLAGVPYAVKNLFDIEGVVTLAGAKLNAGNPAAAADAHLVTRLREAGAILVGALNMDENAYGFTTENTHYGVTRNPHDRARVCGGSSGGSAAAVAAGLVPLSLGSDTNGSIRVPASFCGIFGLKPTYGRLGRGGSCPFVNSLDHVGPFAANVADLAAIYDVLQGPDPADPGCAQRPAEPVSTAPGLASGLPAGIRIGALGGWFDQWADAAARRAVTQAAHAFGPVALAGVELKSAEAARAAAFLITAAEGGTLHGERLKSHYAEFEPQSRARLVAGSLIPAAWVVQAQRVRRQVYAEAMELLRDFDLLLAPAAPVIAPLIGSETLELNGRSLPMRASLGLLTQPLSCIGLPVCTVPLWPDGSAAGAMPLGVQLIAAPWREDLCLAAARTLELAGVARARDRVRLH